MPLSKRKPALVVYRSRCWALSATGHRCECMIGHYADTLARSPSPHKANGVEWYGIARPLANEKREVRYRGDVHAGFGTISTKAAGEGSKRR